MNGPTPSQIVSMVRRLRDVQWWLREKPVGLGGLCREAADMLETLAAMVTADGIDSPARGEPMVDRIAVNQSNEQDTEVKEGEGAALVRQMLSET